MVPSAFVHFSEKCAGAARTRLKEEWTPQAAQIMSVSLERLIAQGGGGAMGGSTETGTEAALRVATTVMSRQASGRRESQS